MKYEPFRAMIKRKYGQAIINSWTDPRNGHDYLELADHTQVKVFSSMIKSTDGRGHTTYTGEHDYYEMGLYREHVLHICDLDEGEHVDIVGEVDSYDVKQITFTDVVLFDKYWGTRIVPLKDDAITFKVVRPIPLTE